MNSIKAKRLNRIAAEFEKDYPAVARELKQLVTNATNPPHPVSRKALREPVESNIKDAVAQVLAKFNPNEVALAGGFAVIQWVDIRKTYDADFVVLGKTFQKLAELFPGGEMKELIYTVKLAGEDVDFLEPEIFPYTDEAIQQAVTKDFMGHKVKVLTPEYLILYKFQAARDKDLDDIRALLTLDGIAEKAEELIGRYMPQEMDDFKSMVDAAEYGL